MATSGGIVVHLLEVNKYAIVTVEVTIALINIKVTVAVISVDKHTHALVSLPSLPPPEYIAVCMMFMCGKYVACG